MVDVPFELELPVHYKREYITIKKSFDIKTDEFPICVSKVVEQPINKGLFKKDTIKVIFHKINSDEFEFSYAKIDEKGEITSGKI